jgi:hypothetical protein
MNPEERLNVYRTRYSAVGPTQTATDSLSRSLMISVARMPLMTAIFSVLAAWPQVVLHSGAVRLEKTLKLKHILKALTWYFHLKKRR